ncbi:Hypothetical protein NGAL_HAMBI1146_59910 [Neorhizobium galegae bv. officinalis]|nr:Hypothetical protein NGAL_HAMBI1146_59910 [Neorhizobium galegae bv. officinalis]
MSKDLRKYLLEKAKLNPIVATGRQRRRWLFWTQYEVEGPVYRERWQTPFNIEHWPRGRYWSYRRPTGIPTLAEIQVTASPADPHFRDAVLTVVRDGRKRRAI